MPYLDVDPEQHRIALVGANLLVQSGEGTTEAINGLGNLIVGYDEDPDGLRTRLGSHNVVIGGQHEYNGHSGLVSGRNNVLDHDRTVAIGGWSNVASGNDAVVVGGVQTRASGDTSAAFAGHQGTVSGRMAQLFGGYQSDVGTEYGTALGGVFHEVSAYGGTTVGGSSTLADGPSYRTVVAP